MKAIENPHTHEVAIDTELARLEGLQGQAYQRIESDRNAIHSFAGDKSTQEGGREGRGVMSARYDADALPAGRVRQDRIAGMWRKAKEQGAIIVVVAVPLLGGRFHAGFEVGEWRASMCHDLHTRADLALACGRRRARSRNQADPNEGGELMAQNDKDGGASFGSLDIVPSGRILPSVSISADMKVNLGDYNSAGAFVSISGVTAETTEAEMDAALANGKIAWDKLRADLREKLQAIRAEREAETEAEHERRAQRRGDSCGERLPKAERGNDLCAECADEPL
jgi:hypothetical protein